MAEVSAPKVIRKIRLKMQVSQEGLSRLLNATKGAVQHWERGRNKPDLARMLALRQICPPSPERKELDLLVQQMQAAVSPLPSASGDPQIPGGMNAGQRGPIALPQKELAALRRENNRLDRRVAKLESTLERKTEQIRTLEGLVKELQRQKQ